MIYIVEDDTDIREMESYALRNSGYEVREFAEGQSFLNACEGQLPRLVLLDIMLPGLDGITILKKLRSEERAKWLPVIMVTAKTTEMDKVRGLDQGADDYLTKPFGIMELVSRVKAVLRRTEPMEEKETLVHQGIYMDLARRTVAADHRMVALTFKEFELLRYMMLNKDIVLTRDQIMDKVWGMDFEGESRTVDMHVKTLRQKLADWGTVIQTVRNVGYRFGG